MVFINDIGCTSDSQFFYFCWWCKDLCGSVLKILSAEIAKQLGEGTKLGPDEWIGVEWFEVWYHLLLRTSPSYTTSSMVLYSWEWIQFVIWASFWNRHWTSTIIFQVSLAKQLKFVDLVTCFWGFSSAADFCIWPTFVLFWNFVVLSGHPIKLISLVYWDVFFEWWIWSLDLDIGK